MDDQTIETEQTNRDAMSNKCDPDACNVYNVKTKAVDYPTTTMTLPPRTSPPN